MPKKIIFLLPVLCFAFHFLEGIEDLPKSNYESRSHNSNFKNEVQSLRTELFKIKSEIIDAYSLKEKHSSEAIVSSKPKKNYSDLSRKKHRIAPPIQDFEKEWNDSAINRKQKKEYYLGMNIGLDFPSNQDYLAGVGISSVTFDNDFATKIRFGKYFGDFLLASSVGYRVSNIDTLTVPYLGELKSYGKSKFFTHSFSLEYDIFLTQKMCISLLQSIGWSYADL
ncbi:MAG: hypothetical protein P8M67_07230, partial [Opitutales bacterium]|nr:hypothetical protein [Opitutales bacterium]